MESATPNDDASGGFGGSASARLHQHDFPKVLALLPPLFVRLLEDGGDDAVARVTLLALAFSVAWAWSGVFAKRLWRQPESDQVQFAILFVLMLPAAAGLGGALLSLSFGWVIGHAIFGGKAILPPALVALAFAIFSFPGGGYETLEILSAAPSPLLALSCLPGAAWLLWKRLLPWRIVVGAIVGAAFAVLLIAESSAPLWWEHFILGAFSIGILFLAAAPEAAPRLQGARWLYGAMIGGLIISIRLANPDHPDGVVLAVLVGGLFAPLLDRAVGWRTSHEQS